MFLVEDDLKTPISRGPLLKNPRSELMVFLEKAFFFVLSCCSDLVANQYGMCCFWLSCINNAISPIYKSD